MPSSKRKSSIDLIEISILIIIWITVFISPVIIQYNTDEFSWETILNNWRRLLPFFLFSVFNHFVLVPLFFFRRTLLHYTVSAVVALVLFNFMLYFMHKPAPPAERDRIVQEFHRPPPPARHSRNPEFMPPPRRLERGPNHPPQRRDTPGGMPGYLNTAFVTLLILGFDTGLRTIFRWTKAEQDKEKLEKEKVKSELAFLRNQVSPHFLMNTLNNIHGLVDIDAEMAKETVIQLSKLMRYLLYDTECEKITIKEEVNFIESYVELMKGRISDRVHVMLHINVFDNEKNIPPLLFTNFIENAFKYGVSYRKDTFIKISLTTTEDELRFELSNTIAQIDKEESSYSGIGLENTQKRLDILYGANYTLGISSENNIFSVTLKIPI